MTCFSKFLLKYEFEYTGKRMMIEMASKEALFGMYYEEIHKLKGE
jgi:hypothetical protein